MAGLQMGLIIVLLVKNKNIFIDQKDGSMLHCKFVF